MNKVRVKIKARLFCKQLKHDMSCISLIRYFYGKGYRVVYFDKNSNGFKSITSYLRIRQRSDDLQSFTYRSEMSSYVFISKKLNYDAKRQSLLREAAHNAGNFTLNVTQYDGDGKKQSAKFNIEIQ